LSCGPYSVTYSGPLFWDQDPIRYYNEEKHKSTTAIRKPIRCNQILYLPTTILLGECVVFAIVSNATTIYHGIKKSVAFKEM
jgi:hypothetical protein